MLLGFAFCGDLIDNQWDDDGNSDNNYENDLTLCPEWGLNCIDLNFPFGFSIALSLKDKLFLLLLSMIYLHHIELIMIYQLNNTMFHLF